MRYVLSALYIIRHCPDKNTVQNYNYPSKRVFFKKTPSPGYTLQLGEQGVFMGKSRYAPREERGTPSDWHSADIWLSVNSQPAVLWLKVAILSGCICIR